MFNTVVSNTPLTDEIAESFFRDKIIDGGQINLRGVTEKSLLATARLLLYPRLREGQKVRISSDIYHGTHMSNDIIRSITQAAERVEDGNAIFKVIIVEKDSVPSIMDYYAEQEKWHEVEKVRLFFVPNFPCCVFVNEEKKVSLLYAELPRSTDTVTRCFHAVQSALLTSNPWFYNSETDKDSVTEAEMGIVAALCKDDYEVYANYLDEFTERVNFREEAEMRLMEDFEHMLDKQRYEDIEYRLGEMKQRIDNLMDDLAHYIQRRKEAELQYQAIKLGIDQRENQFIIRDCFKANKDYKFITIEGNNMIFSINTYLSDWDVAALDNAIHRRRSVMYDQIPSELHDAAEKLFTAIFETKEIKVPMTGVFALASNGRLRAVTRREYDIKADHMPNPHLNFYACLGGYESDIMRAMEDDDWAYALEIASVAAGNVNFEDTTVMRDWTKSIFIDECGQRNCFELPDGSRVVLKKALKWLEERSEDDE